MSNVSNCSSAPNPGSSSYPSVRAGRGKGILKYCLCGEKAVIMTSGTAKNPGRLFYCCPNGSEGDKYHLFTWTDERIVEEVEEMKALLSELKHEVSEMRGEMVGLAKQLEENKLMLKNSVNAGGWCRIL